MLRGVFPLAYLSAALAAIPAVSARSLDLYWIDVEGGAATLIVTPAGESILIDTGMPGGRDSKRIIQAAKDAGLDRIDHLVTTHFHLDHFGGAAEVATAPPVGTIYDNGIPEKNPDEPSDTTRFQRSIQPYRDIKAQKRVVLKPGDSVPLKQAPSTPALTFRCIAGMQKIAAPSDSGHPADCANSREKPKDTSDNANSLVFLLKYGQFDLFDGGDLTWNNEAALVCPRNIIGTVDIYDVNHHGLDVSNNPLLINAIVPTVAIMSNGPTKGCDAETFATLKAAPSIQAIYQTHRNLRPDSQNNTAPEYIANAGRDCKANLIKVSVADDTQSYTVSIPATHHSRVFSSR